MARINFPDKQPAVNPLSAQENEKITAPNVNEIKQAINALYDLIEAQSSIFEGGKIKESLLPSVYFEGFTGDGSITNPLKGGGGSAATIDDALKALPGYDANVQKVLYSLSGVFAWGDVPTGGTLEPLGTPVLTAGTPTVNSIPLSWTSVTDANGYILQRSTQANFAGAVQVYSGSALTFAETGLSANTPYYYRVRAIGGGFSPSPWDDATATTLEQGNVTPPAPTNPVTDDTNDTFNFTYAVGYTGSIADYEYTLNGGTTWAQVTAKPILVGNVAKAAGQVGVRVKAITGRDASAPLYNTTAFTVAAGAQLGTTVTDLEYNFLDNFTNDGNGNLTRNNADSGDAALTYALADAEIGFLSMRFPAFNISGEGSTAVMSLGVGLNPYYGAGDANCIMAIWIQTGGQVVYRKGNSAAVYSGQGVISVNGIARLRTDLTTTYFEVSNNNGLNWTTVTTAPRLAGNLRVKIAATGNQYRAVDLRQFKG